MSTILDLVLDPFCEMISLLDLDDILALWITGNLTLQSKLLKGNAVRNVTVLPRKSSRAPWPPVLQYFDGLTSFKLNRPRFVLTTAVLAQNMLALSRKLTFLSLTAQFAISAFNELMASNSDYFPNLTSLELVSTSESVALKVPLPRTVTNLMLGEDRHVVSSLSLSGLPPGLISLRCYVSSLEIPSLSSTLPPGLETLDLRVPSYPPIFHLIPITCTSLSFRIMQSVSAKLTDDDWQALSRIPLKTLHMPVSKPIGIEEAQYLPKTLESLVLMPWWMPSFEKWLIATMPSLPPNLKIFGERWPEIGATLAQAMPRTLEMSFRGVLPEALAYLPLKTVDVTLIENADVSLITSVPPFLQALTLPKLTPEVAALLPHTLKILTIQSDTNGYTETAIKLLPPHLASLRLQLIDQAYGLQAFDHIQSLEALPKTLTDLSLTIDHNDENTKEIVRHLTPSQSSRSLSRQLKTLELGCLDFSQSNMTDWLLGLPSTITSLKLLVSALSKDSFSAFASNNTITRLYVTSLETPEDGWVPCIASLPKNLKILRLNLLINYDLSTPDSDITDMSFSAIPRSVTDISVPKSPLLTEVAISHLRHLKQLVIGCRTPRWFKSRVVPLEKLT